MTTPARYQFRLALISLPWYLVGSYLIFPLIAAPFSGGLSLAMYVAPFLMFDPKEWRYGGWIMFAAPFLPGLLLWMIRQFFRAAFHVHRAY
jgi:hypothetical protein